MEGTIPDMSTGRMVNTNLAEYHVPVFTDIPTDFVVDFLDIPDPNMADRRPRLGEIGIVGVPAAIANAVYHATGKPIRDLPITPESWSEAGRDARPGGERFGAREGNSAFF